MQAVKAEYLQFPIFTSHVGTCLPVCMLCLTKFLDSNTKYLDQVLWSGLH